MSQETLIFINLSVGVLAVFAGLSLYISGFIARKNQTRFITRKNQSRFVGLANLLISVSTAIVFLITFTSPRNQSGQSTLIVIALLFISTFIASQTIYLFLQRRSGMGLREVVGKQEEDVLKEIERMYRIHLCEDSQLTKVRIITMPSPRDLKDIFVPIKLHEDPTRYPDEAFHEKSNVKELIEQEQELLERMWKRSDPVDIIKHRKHFVILGDPGTGKTTLLKYLTISTAAHEIPDLEKLPIYIELNAFAVDEGRDLLEFIATTASNRYILDPDQTLAMFKNNLKSGNALLLLDALDETFIGENQRTARDSYQRITKMISRLAKTYGQANIVITSRKTSYNQFLKLGDTEDIFAKFEILGFVPEDISGFIKKWFQEKRDQEEFLFRLQRNLRLQYLSSYPLLLAIIATIYSRTFELPESYADLYDRCVDALWQRWDSSRGIIRYHNAALDLKKDLLAAVAWYFHQQGLYRFPEKRLEDFIRTFLREHDESPDKARNMISEIITAHGFLKKIELQSENTKQNNEPIYEFLHPSFQEYFVARYATTHQDQLVALLSHQGDPHWEAVILLYAAYTPDISVLSKKLLEVEKEDIFFSNLIFAGNCVAAAPNRWQNFSTKIIASLFERMDKSRYELTCEQAAEVLAAIGGDFINKRLSLSLVNEHISISRRRKIAEAIGRRGERSLAYSLLSLVSDTSIKVSIRGSIAETLGRLGERSIAQDLVNILLQSTRYTALQKLLANTLGNLREHSVIYSLFACLVNPALKETVGVDIARTIGILADADDIPQLLALLNTRRLPETIRQEIPIILAHLGKNNPSVVRGLQPLVTTESLSWNIRAICSAALYTLGEKDERIRLLDILANSKSDGVTLVSFLEEMDATTLAPDFVTLLTNEHIHDDVRKRIAKALQKLGTKKIVEQLITFLYKTNINSPLDGEIIFTINHLQDEKTASSILLRFLTDDRLSSRLYLRASCARALGWRHSGEVTDFVREQLTQIRHQNRYEPLEVKYDILISLGKLGDSDSNILKELIALLLDPDITSSRIDNIRIRTEEAINIVGDQNTVLQLGERLFNNEEIPYIRRSILQVIQNLTDDQSTCEALSRYIYVQDLREDVYRTLWYISRRLGLRIFINQETQGILIQG